MDGLKKVRLESEKGAHLLITGTVAVTTVYPDLIIWGQRIFKINCFDDKQGIMIYRESAAAVLLEG